MALQTLVNLENMVKERGVVTMPMAELRDAFGYQRLGSNVRWTIAQTLREAGIGYIPSLLPNREREMVRLYDAQNPVKELIEAALDLDPSGDTLLATAARAIDAPEKKHKRAGRPRKPRLVTV